MKKLFTTLLVAVLLLAVFAGCQGNDTPPAPKAGSDQTGSAPRESVSPATRPVAAAPTQPISQYITREEAKTIALRDAAFQESQVRDLQVELDLDDGTVHYDVDFEKDGYDYDYEIDATSGKILRSRKERN